MSFFLSIEKAPQGNEKPAGKEVQMYTAMPLMAKKKIKTSERMTTTTGKESMMED